MTKTTYNLTWRRDLLPWLKKATDRQLEIMETKLEARIREIDFRYPWPALSESFAQDLEALWQEQKFRALRKQHKADMEFGAFNAGRLLPNIHGEQK